MQPEDAIHIKVSYDEALDLKREILHSEMSSLRIAQQINRYYLLRMQELSLKNKIYSKMKETRSTIKKIQDIIPAPKIPNILKRKTIQITRNQKKNKEEEAPISGDVESQLRQIQRRLDQLQRKNT